MENGKSEQASTIPTAVSRHHHRLRHHRGHPDRRHCRPDRRVRCHYHCRDRRPLGRCREGAAPPLDHLRLEEGRSLAAVARRSRQGDRPEARHLHPRHPRPHRAEP